MQMDDSGEQPENGYLSIRESLEFDSNVTLERFGVLLKQPTPIRSILFGIRTVMAFGKQRIIDLSVKSIRTLSMTFQRGFPSSTESDSRSVEMKAVAAISTTLEGIHIDESEEHERNAPSPIRESLESGSNVTVSRFEHRSKQ
jgi:hypothetical protein